MRITFGLLTVVVVAGCGAWERPRLFRPRARPAEGLAVGRQAPEIAGPDLDGVPFKLSDYRGKVVVLDFWGHW
jgi:hypothetical protein